MQWTESFHLNNSDRTILFRKYFNESYYYLDESPATPAPSVIPDWDIDSAPVGKKTAIPAHMFLQVRSSELATPQSANCSKSDKSKDEEAWEWEAWEWEAWDQTM